MLPGMELLACPELAVSKDVMNHVVEVESSRNPYAIGVVGGRLQRQPKTLEEALATARMLEQKGYNFSVGIAQVNRYNLKKYGLDSYTRAFQTCPNLQAGSRILAECYARYQDWGKSFSCYYSGNAVTGFRHGYVQKVFASMAKTGRDPSTTAAIPVTGSASRKAVPASEFPLQSAPSRSVPGISRVVSNLPSAPPSRAADPAWAGSSNSPLRTEIASAIAPSTTQQTITPAPAIATAGPVALPAQARPVRLQPTPTATGNAPAAAPMAPGDVAFVF